MSDRIEQSAEKAESGRPLTLTPEERAEAKALIDETFALATAKAESGRTSMPIYISDAALLLGLAAVALELIPTEGDS